MSGVVEETKSVRCLLEVVGIHTGVVIAFIPVYADSLGEAQKKAAKFMKAVKGVGIAAEGTLYNAMHRF